jgi:hypothetical protein
MHILRILCYNGSLVTWRVVSLTATKFKSLIFSMSGFTLSYTVNMFILMILYDFIIVYTRKVENRVQIADRRALWKISSGAENPFCRRCNFSELDSRAEQSSSLLPVTSQHGHAWHRAPLGPMTIYLLSVKTFVFFSFFRCSSFDKREGLDVFIVCVPLLRLIPPEVTLK